MDKLIITKWNGRILTLTSSDGKASALNLEPVRENSILNNIYVGKVKNIVKNLNAAFVEIGNGQIGYYDLKQNPSHHFTYPSRDGMLREGDEIIVQVQREAVKTKAPILSGNLNFAGKYCVLTTGKTQLGFSNKIPDDEWKKNLRDILQKEIRGRFGLIVRTNAYKEPADMILEEFRALEKSCLNLLELAKTRACYSLLNKPVAFYVSSVRDSLSSRLSEILTDDMDLYQELSSYLKSNQPEDLEKLTFYEDPLLPLSKLYRVDTVMEQAMAKRVWLKSGGYLVIEHTEAFTVVDVNSGKYAGKKSFQEAACLVNMEAAKEIARQMRLRNLSGIIVIDFIDLETEGEKTELMDTFRRYLEKDPVKTTLIDMTKLGLVEVTRKKVRKPLFEQLNGSGGNNCLDNQTGK